MSQIPIQQMQPIQGSTPATHTADAVVSVPPGLPPTKPDSPKVALTQEQVTALVSMAGALVPTLKNYASLIVIVLTAVAALASAVTSWIKENPQPAAVQPAKPPVVAPPQSKIIPVKDHHFDELVERMWAMSQRLDEMDASVKKIDTSGSGKIMDEHKQIRSLLVDMVAAQRTQAQGLDALRVLLLGKTKMAARDSENQYASKP